MTAVESIGDNWRDSGQPERRRPGAWWTSTPLCIFPRNAAKCNNEWIQFDEVGSEIIQTSKGNADRRLNVLSAIIVSYAKERFGLREGKQEKTYCKNRRAKKVQDLRRKLRALKKKYKQASEGERQPLTELREILREKLRTIRKAEWHRRRRKERARKRHRPSQIPSASLRNYSAISEVAN